MNLLANTPSACIDRYTVRARLAAASGVPNALPSATTEKLLMPLPDRLRSAKNPVRKMIVGVSTEVSPCFPPTAPAACIAGARLSMPRTRISGVPFNPSKFNSWRRGASARKGTLPGGYPQLSKSLI